MEAGTPASHPPTHPSGSTTTTSTVNVGVGERRQNRPSCGVDTLYSSPIDMPSLFPWVELQKQRALPSCVDFCSHSCGRGQASRRKSCKSGPGSLWGKVASVLFSWCAEGQVPLRILCPAAQRWRKFVWRPRDPKLIMTVHLVSATVAILACQPVWLWVALPLWRPIWSRSTARFLVCQAESGWLSCADNWLGLQCASLCVSVARSGGWKKRVIRCVLVSMFIFAALNVVRFKLRPCFRSGMVGLECYSARPVF